MQSVDSKWQLERAVPAQAESLSGLMRDTFMAAYGDIASLDTLERYQSRVYAPAHVAGLLTRRESEIWVLRAASDAAAAGYVQISTRPGPVPVGDQGTSIEVQRCYLGPAFIGSGGADVLMRQAQSRARTLGAERIHLSVYQVRPRVIRFYERHGFKIVAPVRFFLDDIGFDDWLMVCELGS